jgi:hypothetical protein
METAAEPGWLVGSSDSHGEPPNHSLMMKPYIVITVAVSTYASKNILLVHTLPIGRRERTDCDSLGAHDNVTRSFSDTVKPCILVHTRSIG